MSNYFHFLKGQNKLERLRRFNFIMGFLHLIQGIAMVFLAIFVIEKNCRISTSNCTALYHL